MAKKNDGNTKTPYQNFKAVSFDFWGAPIGKNPDGTLYCPGFHMQGDKPGTTANAYAKSAFDFVGIDITGPRQQGEGNFQQKTPGLAKLNIKKGRALDLNKPAGSDGGTAIWHGLANGRVEIALTIWTPEQLAMLRILWKNLQPPAGKAAPAAFSCYHPALKDQAITALQFYEIEGPSPGPAVRSMVYVIRALEFLPPGKKNVTKKDEAPKRNALDPTTPKPPGTDKRNTGPN